jgi:hypothetical protein
MLSAPAGCSVAADAADADAVDIRSNVKTTR